MTETISPAEVVLKEELRLVPLYIGEMKPSVPVDTHDFREVAAKTSWNQRCIGFAFAEAVSARIRMPGRDDIEFAKETVEDTRYLFAEKVVTREEYMTAPAYQEDFLRTERNGFKLMTDPESILFEFNRRVYLLAPEDKKHTVLIDHGGRQLWPSVATPS